MTLILDSSFALIHVVAAAGQTAAGSAATAPVVVAPANTWDFTSFFALLATLSVATQKLVDIAKAWITYLKAPAADATPPPDPVAEQKREHWVQFTAGICGCIAVGAAWPAVVAVPLCKAMITAGGYWWLVLVVILGLLSSGGSGPWNDFTTWLQNMKNQSGDALASKKALGPTAGASTPTPASGPLMSGKGRAA